MIDKQIKKCNSHHDMNPKLDLMIEIDKEKLSNIPKANKSEYTSKNYHKQVSFYQIESNKNEILYSNDKYNTDKKIHNINFLEGSPNDDIITILNKKFRCGVCQLQEFDKHQIYIFNCNHTYCLSCLK